MEYPIDQAYVNDIENYVILSPDGQETEVVSIEFDPESNKVLVINTSKLQASTVYSITIYNLTSIGALAISEDGLSLTFETASNPDARYFDIVSESQIFAGTPFFVSVTTLYSVSESPDSSYQNELNVNQWELSIEEGNLSSVVPSEWNSGMISFMATYENEYMEGTDKEIMTIRISDPDDPLIFGVSNPITVNAPVHMDHFEFDTPVTANPDQSIPITLYAIGTNTIPYADYNENVSLKVYDENNELIGCSPATVSNFNEGIAEISLHLAAQAEAIYLKATQGNYTGTSQVIQIQLGLGDNALLSLSACPYSNNEIGLSWNQHPNAVGYYVYRKLSEEDDEEYILVETIHGSDAIEYQDTTVSSDNTYTYKLVRFNETYAVMGTATATVQSNECGTTISAGNGDIITQATIWSKAAGPYCITSDLDIESGGSLVIEPGTVIKIYPGIGINVKAGGELVAIGTHTEYIIFTASTRDSAADSWNGISFEDDAIPSSFADVSSKDFEYLGGSYLEYIVVEFGSQGIKTCVSLGLEWPIIRHQVGKSSATAHGTGFSSDLDDGETVYIYRNLFINNRNVGSGYAAAFSNNVDGYAHIEKNTFSNNRSYSYAGAVFINSSSDFVQNNLFQNNYSDFDGGALASAYGADGCLIKNNVFRGNSASEKGGAIATKCPYVVEDNYFDSNTSGTDGGAIYMYGAGTFTNNTFINNTSHHFGGAMYLHYHGHTVQDNQFIKNMSYDRAGAINVNGNSCLIKNNLFDQNECITEGGAVFDDWTGNTYEGNTFQFNISNDLGGGLFIEDGETLITNNLFYGNHAPSRGEAIHTEDANITITNNTFLLNSSNYQGGAVFMLAPSYISLSYNEFSQNTSYYGSAIYMHSNIIDITLDHNNIYDNSPPVPSFNTLVHAFNTPTITATFCYWGGETANKSLMGICDGSYTCGVAPNDDGIGTITMTNTQSEPWGKCTVSSVDCVGIDWEFE